MYAFLVKTIRVLDRNSVDDTQKGINENVRRDKRKDRFIGGVDLEVVFEREDYSITLRQKS